MSLARLGALALRGATPPGVARLPLAPAFDPIVALDAAASMPAEAGPAARRQSPMPHLAMPMAAGLVARAEPSTPMSTLSAATEPMPASPPQAALHGAAPSILQTPAAISTPVTPAPDFVPHRSPASNPDMAPAPLPRVVTMAPAPPIPASATHHAESAAIQRSLHPAPLPDAPAAISRPAAPGARHSAAVQPAPTQQAVAPDVLPAAPEIHIGRIEVVMAPAPPAAPPPPRSAPATSPPRDFSRYAAMRGARDRRW